MPAYGPGALALFGASLVVLCLAVSPLRWLAFVPGVLGLWLANAPERADIYIDREGRGAAVRSQDAMLVPVGRASAFATEQWLRADGDAREVAAVIAGANARCDALGCTAEAPDGRAVAVVLDRRAFETDCRRAAIVVTALRAPPTCKAPLVIDRGFLEKNGATSIRLAPSGPVIATARPKAGTRAWMARAGPALRPPVTSASVEHTGSLSREPEPPPDTDLGRDPGAEYL